MEEKTMSDDIYCDNCGAHGRRRRGKMVPEGWFFAEMAMSTSPGDVSILAACSEKCCVLRWKQGPGSLQDPDPPRFPNNHREEGASRFDRLEEIDPTV